jgi:hypothetical protein
MKNNVNSLHRFSFGLFAATTLCFGSMDLRAQSNPSITNLVNQGLTSAIGWQGGTGIFVLQKKYDLSDPAWINVLTTSNRDFVIPREADTAFFRLQSQATNTVLAFTAFLTGPAEVPAVSSAGIGIAAFSLEGSSLSYYVKFSGLSGAATLSHIHGPATPLTTAGVMINFSPPPVSSGAFSGKTTLTQDQITNLVNGLCYANIHTSAHAGGEIRGQVVPLRMVVPMDGPDEVPATASSGTARAILTFIGDHLFYNIPFTNLTSSAVAAHFHGPATPTTTAGVLIGLPSPSGTSGTISGSLVLTPQQLTYILGGQTYLNIHTVNNGGGEIRGQVWPLQFGVFMDGPDEVPVTTSLGTGGGIMNIVSNKLSYSFGFSNLTSSAIAAHIHGPASPTTTAGVMIGFTPPAATSGTFSGTATLTSAQLFNIINGISYANIHSVNFGGGEIRGQIYPVTY